MKQCKVCGTLVHIDSITCPSCGNHSFFVLDVKICPLCGKVNRKTSSFCEQCGKQFSVPQGLGAYAVKKPPVNVRPVVYREKESKEQKEPYKEPRKEPKEDYEIIEKPAVKSDKSEEIVEKTYKDFVALKPRINEKDDVSEYSYFVKGEGDRLPVVILPKFAKTQGKNIMVNIIIGEQAAQEQHPAPAQPAEEPQPQPEVEYKPFSAIKEEPEEKAFETAEAVAVEPQAVAKSEEKAEPAPARKPLLKKSKYSAGSVIASVLMALLSLGVLASYLLVFYNSLDSAQRASGASIAVYLVNDLLSLNISLPANFNDGFLAWTGGGYAGELGVFAHLVPYIAGGAAVLALINTIIVLTTFRHRRWAKAVLIITGLLLVLGFGALIAAIEFVYKANFTGTLGIGLMSAAAVSLVFFILAIAAYKPGK